MSKLVPPNSSMMRVAATSWKAQTSWPVGMMKEGGRAQPVVPVSLGVVKVNRSEAEGEGGPT